MIYYLEIKLIKGETLHEYIYLIRKLEIFPERAVLATYEKILSAYAQLQAVGVSHRDIKPDNIILQFS